MHSSSEGCRLPQWLWSFLMRPSRYSSALTCSSERSSCIIRPQMRHWYLPCFSAHLLQSEASFSEGMTANKSLGTRLKKPLKDTPHLVHLVIIPPGSKKQTTASTAKN